MLFDYIDTLYSKSYQDASLTIPSDLCELVNSLVAVKRFQFKEYPPNVIIDNTYTHTLKCIGLARASKISLNQVLLERMLWVHDIPEILIRDVTVTEKYRDKKIDQKVEKSEEEASRHLLSIYDRGLLKRFNAASDFLKGKMRWDENTIGFEAVSAKLIDNSEGNMTFHFFITNWIRSDKFEECLMPPLDSIIHTFVTNQKFKEAIEKNLSSQYSEVLLPFIECVLDNVRVCWRSVLPLRIPSQILKYL